MDQTTSFRYFLFMLYLALLSMLAFIATDMYLPAFKAIEGTFNTTPTLVAMSLTTFLAGLAIGQLLYGPIVQKMGSRNALFLGLAIFGIASFFISESQTILMLNVARFFQALGACSAAVIWQALVVEQYKAEEAQGIFSNIMPLVALSPALAPILGAHMQESYGWQAIFITLCVLAAVLVLMTMLLVPKQNKINTNENIKSIGFSSMLKNKRFLGNVIVFGTCCGAFFSYLTVWPIVMELHGYDAAAIGLSFIPQTIMFVVGGYACKLLIKKIGAEKTLKILLTVFGCCALMIVIFTLLFELHSIYPLLITFSILAAANGGIYPIVVNNALQEFTQNAAKAAGLQNFIQTGLSFGASSLVATWAAQGDKAIGWGILICTIGVMIGYKIQSSTKVNMNSHSSLSDDLIVLEQQEIPR